MLTNFGALTSNQLTGWEKKLWSDARNRSFLMAFAGDGPNSMIQRITKLRKTKDGARAVITLVSDSQGDGVVGDNQLEGSEEALSQDDCVIQLDQHRHAHRSQGRMAEQAQLVEFRYEAKDKGSYWLADRTDQIGFLILSGVSLAYKNNGALRVGSQLPNLKFAADITAPSSKRYARWNSTSKTLDPAGNSALTAADKPSWAMLVETKAQLTDSYMRPIRTDDGIDVWNVFMSPRGIAKLKQDPDFLDAWKHARERGPQNPIFKGTKHGGKEGIFIDGLNILEYRHVFTTLGATSGSGKWGASNDIDGQRVIFAGAQAMALADIGNAIWDEKYFDYGNSQGIAFGKIWGLLKPQLYSIYAGSKQDHGVYCVDTAI